MDIVSIIIAVYDVEEYLDKCIESVINQSYTDIEVIVINDGSNDKSLEICQKWQQKDSRITVYDQDNQGLSSVRNRGIKLATGKYLFFLDGDDWLDYNTMERLMDMQQKSEAEIVCFGIQEEFEDGTSVPFTDNNSFEGSGKEAVLEMMNEKNVCSMACNKLYLKKLWEEVCFPPKKMNEDEFTIYKILYKSKKVIFLPSYYYHYVRRNNGLMSKIRSNGNIDKVYALKERTQFFFQSGDIELYIVSMLKTIDYLKYVFRMYIKDKRVKKKLLETIYLEYRLLAQEAVRRKEISILQKTKIVFWRLFFRIRLG